MSSIISDTLSYDTIRGEFLQFELGPLTEQEPDIYNPFPFQDNGHPMLFGRVESPEIETDTRPGVFSFDEGTWRLAGFLNLEGTWQDLFHCGTFYDAADNPFQIFGGVHVFEDNKGEISGWDTELFSYTGSVVDLTDPNYKLEPLVVGPWKMKGIRPKQLDNGRIGVLARPQGDFGGLGSIGYFEVDSYIDLQPAVDYFAGRQDVQSLLRGLCDPNCEWVGPNQVIQNPDGNLRVIGHKAWFERDIVEGTYKKVYEGVVFDMDPGTRETSTVVTIARADMFQPGVIPKKDDMGPIVYPGGVAIDPASNVEVLYAGVGDRKSGKLPVSVSALRIDS